MCLYVAIMICLLTFTLLYFTLLQSINQYQSLCSRAKVVLGNQYSTFSRGIFKKALWNTDNHMLKYSFAWSKGQTINYFEKDWLERQLDKEIAKRQSRGGGR